MRELEFDFNAIFNKRRKKIALICVICFLIIYKFTSAIITYCQIDGFMTVTQDADGYDKYGFIYNGKEYIELDELVMQEIIYGIDVEAINSWDKVYFHYGKKLDNINECVYGFKHDPYQKFFTDEPTKSVNDSGEQLWFVQKDFVYPSFYYDSIYKIELIEENGNSINIENSITLYDMVDQFINELKMNGTIKKSLVKYGYDDKSNYEVYVYYDYVPICESIGIYTKSSFELSERYQKQD